MRNFLLKILLLIILPVLMADAWFRTYPTGNSTVYMEVAHQLKDNEINIFFEGTSRVAAAIDADAASRYLRKILNLPIHVYNLGSGFTTLTGHVLGTKMLIKLRPQAMKNSIWLMEAPMGLPPLVTWNDPWYNSGTQEYFLKLLSISDLSQLWRAKGMSSYEKGYISAAYFSPLAQALLETRSRLNRLGEVWTDRVIQKFSKTKLKTSEVAPTAGIKNDDAAIQYARHWALLQADELRTRLKDQTPIRNWQQLIVYDWKNWIDSVGGHSYFFEMPLSSVQAEEFETETRRRDRVAFRSIAKEWNTPVIELNFQTTDDDFPDLWHLRMNRRKEFTDGLIISLLSLRNSALPGN